MRIPKIIRKILNLLRILRIYYVHTFVATLKTFLGRARQCQEEWARMTFQYLRVRVVELTGNRPLSNGKVMVYASHRSQADFFLHNVLLDFRTNFLSRMAVLLASPNFIVSYKTVWFFNRGQRLHPQKFNEWLDYKYERSPRPALLVYPEGHRMQGFHKADPMMLKTGMFKYAYRRKMPAQILITFGNEDIFDEKRLHVAFNQTVYYKLSQVIEASDFETENEYIAEVKQRFCQLFDETYEQYTQAKQRGLRREENMRMAPRTI